MDANGVNMVAIGLEQLGAQEFVDGNFFDGEVYVDEGKKSYQALGYKRFTWLSIWTALLSRISRAALSEAKRMNVSGNLSGDGLQNGGLLVVDKGGSKVLLNHREESPGDHAANEAILQSLGITEVIQSDKPEPEAEDTPVDCSEVCALPPPKVSRESEVDKKTN